MTFSNSKVKEISNGIVYKYIKMFDTTNKYTFLSMKFSFRPKADSILWVINLHRVVEILLSYFETGFYGSLRQLENKY